MATPSHEFLKTELFGVGDVEPVGRQVAIPAPVGGATVDAEARAAINLLITRLEAFGLVGLN
ncbi:hypothetical protein [Pseudonocardia broussonetiae]|uniref:Uncharacterized protein n=1 Tax=Pseudonocardia broussonetiae TaxID=2736640 RepID=A0A6M6JV17_9PSEU|nr:hypothetical protein [Pseudonocardia broussonetiae]QJY51255.1 hypothetical protein HOP40_35330 [Pseudonocardia broussonetiae]